MKMWIVLGGLLLTTTMASAGEIVITVPDDVEVTTDSVLYACGDANLSATYYNAGEISLVELEMEDQTIVASNVISGSGAKYAGGIYVWWNKGDSADLYNIMEDPDMADPVHCVSQ